MGGGTGTPELAAAVSRAGGLGMLSSTFPLPVGDPLSWVQARTDRPVGVGFFAFDVPARTGELEFAAARVRVVDVFWGDPDAAVVERIHAGGALAVNGQVFVPAGGQVKVPTSRVDQVLFRVVPPLALA